MAKPLDSIKLKIDVETDELDEVIEKFKELEGNLVYIVYLNGMHRNGVRHAIKEQFEQALEGKVVVVDEMVSRIELLTPSARAHLVELLCEEGE